MKNIQKLMLCALVLGVSAQPLFGSWQWLAGATAYARAIPQFVTRNVGSCAAVTAGVGFGVYNWLQTRCLRGQLVELSERYNALSNHVGETADKSLLGERFLRGAIAPRLETLEQKFGEQETERLAKIQAKKLVPAEEKAQRRAQIECIPGLLTHVEALEQQRNALTEDWKIHRAMVQSNLDSFHVLHDAEKVQREALSSRVDGFDSVQKLYARMQALEDGSLENMQAIKTSMETSHLALESAIRLAQKVQALDPVQKWYALNHEGVDMGPAGITKSVLNQKMTRAKKPVLVIDPTSKQQVDLKKS